MTTNKAPITAPEGTLFVAYSCWAPVGDSGRNFRWAVHTTAHLYRDLPSADKIAGQSSDVEVAYGIIDAADAKKPTDEASVKRAAERYRAFFAARRAAKNGQ
jgi:hypothetical protein